MRMSFLTDCTPLTARATSMALLVAASELTRLLSCTVPLKVSTLISVDFRIDSPKMAALNLEVMMLYVDVLARPFLLLGGRVTDDGCQWKCQE